MKIAVFGKTRSGKSTVCEILSKELGTSILDFGDALKKCVSIVYPETKNQPKNRSLLIQVGQHLRKMDKNIWVNALKYKIENLDTKNIIVTGIRQDNEYKMLKELGFKFIKVSAPLSTRRTRSIEAGDNFKEEDFFDETEKAIDGFECNDFIWNDDLTIEELEAKVIKSMETVSSQDGLHKTLREVKDNGR